MVYADRIPEGRGIIASASAGADYEWHSLVCPETGQQTLPDFVSRFHRNMMLRIVDRYPNLDDLTGAALVNEMAKNNYSYTRGAYDPQKRQSAAQQARSALSNLLSDKLISLGSHAIIPYDFKAYRSNTTTGVYVPTLTGIQFAVETARRRLYEPAYRSSIGNQAREQAKRILHGWLPFILSEAKSQ